MFDLLQEIYSSIKNNKLRTFLTGFAVAWGIFILIVLLGAGNGLLNAFLDQSGRFDTSSMQVSGGYTSQPYKGYQRWRRIKLKEADMSYLMEELDEYLYNGGVELRISSQVSTRKDYIQGSVSAIYPNFEQANAIPIVKGRFVNYADLEARRKVVVISEDSSRTLFGTDDPIGKYVTINQLSFQVVGVYQSSSMRDNKQTYVPFKTTQLIYNKNDVGSLLFQMSDAVKSIADNELLEERIRTKLAQVHQFNPADHGAVWIWNRLKMFFQQQDAANYLRVAIWVIGILTLLSGVVGVSNIMLITVKERTREFGIRKALGAKPSSILVLVLAESIIITTCFGYIGMLAGIAATEWMNKVAGNEVVDMGAFSQTVFTNPTVDIHIAIQATLTLIIAGTIAGFIPARNAVKIKPVDALNAR